MQKVRREWESTYRCYFCPSKENQKTKITFMFFSVLQESNIRNSLESRIRAGIIPILAWSVLHKRCWDQCFSGSDGRFRKYFLFFGTQEKLGNHTSLQFMLSPQFSTCSKHFIPKQTHYMSKNFPSVQQSLDVRLRSECSKMFILYIKEKEPQWTTNLLWAALGNGGEEELPLNRKRRPVESEPGADMFEFKTWDVWKKRWLLSRCVLSNMLALANSFQ